MRIVFMGTPNFAVASLRALAAAHDVCMVVTAPDAVRGRGRKLVPSPVKEAAVELGIDVLEARRIGPEQTEAVRQAAPDVICVAAYGALLPDELLSIPALGTVNVHASLLPKGRGAAPIQRAVLEGDEFAGVSIMRIVHELDAGPYCAQAQVRIADKPCAQVMAEVAELGANELLKALGQMENGTVCWTEQDASQATYAAKVTKAEMLLDPTDSVRANALRVQASLDAAPARATVGGKGVRVTLCRVAGEQLEPAEVAVRKGKVYLGCADGSIELLRLKPDGKREMEASAWASGLRAGSLVWGRA